MHHRRYVIGVDIGGTNVRIGAVSENMELLHAVKLSSASVFAGGDAGGALLSLVENFIAQMDGGVEAVSIGFPSTLDRARTTVISTPNVSGLDNIPVVAMLEEHFRVPIVIEKDACMMLYNDIYHHNIPLSGVVIGCYFGTGMAILYWLMASLSSGKTVCSRGTRAYSGHRQT